MEISELENKIIEALKLVYDPEIPVNIYEMGMIYEIKVKEGGNIYIKMTLTSPACPVAESLPVDVKARVESIEGVNQVYVDVVWDPPWTQDMMSEEAKLELGFF
ncbi:MAG: SUF system Fe-S cluster assembly protein [Ignavibacteria bacterium]|nr:SUF system Fe-S cluster assembly protein [Ignavibacteria bacterium]